MMLLLIVLLIVGNGVCQDGGSNSGKSAWRKRCYNIQMPI